MPFLLALVAVLGLYVVIDVFQKFDDLLRSGLVVSARFYLYQVPVILGLIMPAIVLVAVIFTVLRMERRNEITGMLVSGTSLFRALVAFYFIGGVITVGLLANQQWVVPALGMRILRTEWEALDNHETVYRDVVVRDGNNRVFWISSYNFVTMVMADVTVLRFYPSGEPKQYIRAPLVKYEARPEEGWYMSDCVVQSYLPTGQRDESQGPGGAAHCTEMRLDSDLKPAEIGSKELEAAFMSYSDLWYLTRKHPHLKALRVVLHSRLAFPVTTLVVLLLCLPLVLRRRKERPLEGAGVAVVSFLAFFTLFMTSLDQGMKGNLPPELSAWLPLGLFGAAGLVVLAEMRS